ncbi:MAG: hypothetical protein ACOZAJ_03105 [Patescibacteria group bacterium]
MYLSRRNLVIIISSIAVLLVVAIILWQFKGDSNQTTENTQVNTQLDDSPSAIAGNNAAIELPLGQSDQTSTEDGQRYQMQAKARLFAEKFGSYSTDNSFANILSVADLTTPVYQSRLNALIKQPPADNFYTVITRALAVEVVDETVNKVTIKVNTQRQEAVSRDEQPTVKYQILELAMVLVNNDWLVNGAEWQ